TKKGAARGCKRPKSREETPKEGGGNATRSRYRAAAICPRAAQKARVADIILGTARRRVDAGGRHPSRSSGHNLRKTVPTQPSSGLGWPPSERSGRGSMTAVDFSAFVDELATLSGETILPFFRTALSVEDKSRGMAFDPVTAADRAAETAMRSLIRRSFPAHGIIGEEFGEDRSDAEYVWVLD